MLKCCLDHVQTKSVKRQLHRISSVSRVFGDKTGFVGWSVSGSFNVDGYLSIYLERGVLEILGDREFTESTSPIVTFKLVEAFKLEISNVYQLILGKA